MVLEPNLEGALGYLPPASDKPYKAYEHVKKWSSADFVPQAWRDAMCRLFDFDWSPLRPETAIQASQCAAASPPDEDEPPLPHVGSPGPEARLFDLD